MVVYSCRLNIVFPKPYLGKYDSIILLNYTPVCMLILVTDNYNDLINHNKFILTLSDLFPIRYSFVVLCLSPAKA